MHHPFVPLMLLVLAPVLGVAWATGLWARRAVRWAIATLGGLLLAASVGAGGVEFADLNRMKLWVAAAAVLVLALRQWGLAGFNARRSYLAGLAAVAVVAGIIYFNFFAFHGVGTNRVYIHLHDVAHYYLGSKYFREVGYADLYTAMLRAEAERYDNHFKAVEARDLRTNALVHIRVLLTGSDAVKARFTPERWAAFQQDVAFFREAMGPQYGDVLRDHGFNPTPVWALLGGALANLIPAGSARGILLLTLLDLALEAGLFAAIGWAFGGEVLLLALIEYCALYGASFGWTGGSYLRYLWLLGVIGSACCLQRGRYATAGALLAWASCLRIFPALFAAGLVCKAGAALIRQRAVPVRYARFGASFIATAALLLAGTAVLPRGVEHWREFHSNLQRHMATDATNMVGLAEIVTYTGAAFPATAEEAAHERARRRAIALVQLAIALPVLVAFIAARSPHEDDVGAMALGATLVFGTLSLASYYYAFLLLLVFAHRRHPWRLALIFGCEAVTYCLALFEDREVVVFFYRNVLIAYLLVALYGAAARDEVSRLLRWIRRHWRPAAV